jgi:hypothetical protein
MTPLARQIGALPQQHQARVRHDPRPASGDVQLPATL